MRWIIGLVSLLLMLGVVAIGAIALIPSERVAEVAADQFKRLTGRELVLSGAVEPTLWPTLGVRTGPVSMANASWSDEGPMFEAEALEINLDMAALIAGEIRIIGIAAEAPRVLLERSKDGQENWVFGGGGAGGEVSTATPGVGRAYTLARGVINGGTFRFIDHQAGTRVALDAVTAEVAIPDFTGPATLTGSAMMNGAPVEVSVTAGVFSALTEGRVVPMSVTLTGPGLNLGFEGRAGLQPLSAEGSLALDISNVGQAAALAAMADPGLPAGLGASLIGADGALTVTEDGSAYLRGAVLRLDGNTLTGDIDIRQGGPRPKISAQINAGTLDLSAMAAGGGSGGQGGSAAASEGWSNETIDVSGLGAVDASVALVADAIDLGTLKLGPTRVMTTLDRARAVFDIRELQAYGGSVSGQFVTNGRGGLSVGGNLTFAGIAVQPLLADLAGYDRLIGQGDLRVKFLGVGNSMAALMQGLEGEGALSLGKGELRGLDVAGMLRSLDPNFVGEGQKTIFDSVTASFSIAGGVLSNADLKLAAPLLTATGAGTIGIGARTLDYSLRPTALAEADGSGGIMVPLLITGTWANPKFSLDLESIARERMEEEAKKLEEEAKARAKELEAEAKAKLEEKAREELGIEIQEGEDLEAAARRRAQEVLDAEAQKLLEGLLR